MNASTPSIIASGALVFLLTSVPVYAADTTAIKPTSLPVAPAKALPIPTHSNLSYGPHSHQIMDVHLPHGVRGPFPVLVWYGGLWDASKHVPALNRFLPSGIAVVGVESRTLNDAMKEKIYPPISWPMDDACRAVQFVRMNAANWNIDPNRIATGGGSQGALPALYVGCVPDRKDPSSSDPVLRESTKVTCVAAYRSQPSIDPIRMQQWVPGVKWGAPALGVPFDESLRRRDDLMPIIMKYSPENLVHKGSAAIYFENEWGLKPPGGGITHENYIVHSPAWGIGFKELADKAGVTCFNKYLGHPTDGYDDIWDFILKKLRDGR